jgi:protein O-mannosyl-transferase
MQQHHTEPAFFPEKSPLPWLLLAGAVVAVYAASISNGFVFFDDDKAILYNPALKNPSLGKFFSGQNLGMYAPVTWIAYWIGHSISGEEAWGYHLLGMLIHALNSCLVFSILRSIFGRPWVAFAAALLFAVHPVQVEAVSWAAALSTVLFALFYLLSFRTYLDWRQSPTLPRYALTLGAFLLACLSKSAAVTLPVVLLAVDFYLDKKLERKFWLSKIPYFLIAIAFGLYTFITREQEGHNIAQASAAFSVVDRFFMISQTLLFYPVKLLAPIGFSIAYPFVKMEGKWPLTYYLAPLVLAGMAFFVWKKGKSHPEWLMALALYLLPLGVMLPFRTVGSFELRSDRYVYFSCIGIFLMGAFLLEKIKTPLRHFVLGGVAALLAFLSFRQTAVWKEGVALFENCVEKTPESSLCQCNLAYNELITLRFEKAVKHYSEALKYDPSVVEAYNGRGQAYLQLKKIPEALADFENAIRAGIVTPKLFLNKGKCLVMLNQGKEALPALDKSIALEAKNPETWYYRANAREKTGDLAGAAQDYGEAIRLKPDYVEPLINRGLLLMQTQQYEAAIQDYTRAINAAPRLEMAYNNRAYALLKTGQAAKGLEDVNKALEINPNYLRAYQTRGFIYQALGQNDKAQADFARGK